jgi:sugar phosphate isomerase/epimerase
MVQQGFTDIGVDETYGALRYTVDRVSQLGMKVCVENVWPETTLPEELSRMRQEQGLEDVGLLLDIGHINLALNWPWMYKRYSSISEYITALPVEIMEIHLHDNDGTADQHLPIGHGKADIAGLVHTLLDIEYPNALILENVPRTKQWEEETVTSKERVEIFTQHS